MLHICVGFVSFGVGVPDSRGIAVSVKVGVAVGGLTTVLFAVGVGMSIGVDVAVGVFVNSVPLTGV